MYQTPIGYVKTYSDECAPGGSGQCDGYGYDDDTSYPCECSCHITTADIGQTVAQVKTWHAALWATYEPGNPYLPRKV